MKFITSLLFLLYSHSCLATVLIFDSFKNQNQKPIGDSSQVDTLIKKAREIENTNPQSSIQYSKQAAKLSKDIHFSRGISESLNSIGKGFLSQGVFDSACYYFRKGLVNARTASDLKNVSISLMDIGIVFKNQGIYDSAIVYYHKGLSLAESINNLELRSNCLNNIGNVLKAQGNIKEAIIYFSQALEIQSRLNTQNTIASTTLNLGICYGLLDDYAEAQSYFKKAFIIYFKLNDKRGMARCNNNLAQSLESQGKLEEAMPFLKEALQLYNTIGDKNGTASTIYSLALLNEHLKNYDQAFNLSTQSLLLAKAIGNKKLQFDNYNFLQKISIHSGNYEEAYQYLSSADTLKDSLFNENKTKTIQELQTKYETAKKEQEIKILDQENKTKKLQRDFFLFGSIALLISFVALLFIFVQRQRISRQQGQIQNQKFQELLKSQEIHTYNAMLEGQEAERKRIAIDLHDRLGSMLSTVKAYFTAVKPSLQTNGSSEIQMHEKATSLLDLTFDELRTIANDLSTGTISNLGLLPAIEDLSDTISRGSGVECKVLAYNLDKRIDNQTEIGIYRITQELLSNILKHAKANHITIQLNRIDDSLQVSVEDDGIGYDYVEKMKSPGMGLKNILTRVEKLNGKFHVDSSIGEGSFAFLEIPIRVEGIGSLHKT